MTVVKPVEYLGNSVVFVLFGIIRFLLHINFSYST